MHRILVSAVLAATLTPAAAAQPSALDKGYLGLYDASAFRAVDGRCAECSAPKPGLWYFEGDLVAIPKEPQWPGTAFSHSSVMEDVRTWSQRQVAIPALLPFMSWLGSPEIVEGAKLSADGHSLKLENGPAIAFDVTPKIPTNRSYYDHESIAYFGKRTVRVRGTTDQASQRFVARVIWPEDYRIAGDTMQLAALQSGESLTTLMTAEDGGAKSEFSTRLLWRSSTPAKADAKRAVLAIMLNGAQGDDDEAHGGHFAVVTGWQHADGKFADWMVNNFYNLGSFSEKGIIASMLPMDNYLMDLNSGQSYYRPSYMLVAVLKRPDAAQWYQQAIERVFDRFYRHHIEYDHAKSNCAGISVDTLSGLGWQLPALGVTSYAKAGLGYFYSAASDMSFASGKRTFNYMVAERSRLYPRAAFETVGQDLLDLVARPNRTLTRYEQTLHDDVESIVFVRIPQIPSSRAFGTYPVASFDEYMARVPKDRKDWKIVPVDPRPFPQGLRDFPVDKPVLSDTSIGVLASGGLLAAIWTPIAMWRRRARTRSASA